MNLKSPARQKQIELQQRIDEKEINILKVSLDDQRKFPINIFTYGGV